MLASARVFGHVFNPLSVFWCHDAAGELRCVVVEVHNTYGQRHCYLLETGRHGPGERPEGVLRLAVQRRRRPVPDEAAGTRRAARRLDRPGAGRAEALRRHRGRRPPRSDRAEHPVRGARRPAGAAAGRRADPLAGNQAWARRCPSSKDHTTPHRRQSSDHDRSDRIPRTGREHHAHRRQGLTRDHPGCPTRFPAARGHRRRDLAQHRGRTLQPQGPAGGTAADAIFRAAVRACRWQCATPTAPSWARR